MARRIDLDRVAAVRAAETERFVRERPQSMARIETARVHMPLGVPMKAGARDIPALRHAQRAFMANRGVFEFGWWCGPAVSAQATADDIELYLDVFGAFIRTITADDASRATEA